MEIDGFSVSGGDAGRRRVGRANDDVLLVIIGIRFGPERMDWVDLGDGEDTDAAVDMSVESQQRINC